MRKTSRSTLEVGRTRRRTVRRAGTVSLELDLRAHMGDDAAIKDILVRQRQLSVDLLRVRA